MNIDSETYTIRYDPALLANDAAKYSRAFAVVNGAGAVSGGMHELAGQING